VACGYDLVDLTSCGPDVLRSFRNKEIILKSIHDEARYGKSRIRHIAANDFRRPCRTAFLIIVLCYGLIDRNRSRWTSEEFFSRLLKEKNNGYGELETTYRGDGS
jgi:hypothetical protein